MFKHCDLFCGSYSPFVKGTPLLPAAVPLESPVPLPSPILLPPSLKISIAVKADHADGCDSPHDAVRHRTSVVLITLAGDEIWLVWS